MDQRRDENVGGSGDTSNMRSRTAPTPELMRLLAQEHKSDPIDQIAWDVAVRAVLMSAADQIEHYERDHNLVTREWHDVKMREVRQ